MMEVQEEEEEAPEQRQGYTYNHVHPHTTPQHKQDSELNEPRNCFPATEDYRTNRRVEHPYAGRHTPKNRKPLQ